MASPLDNLDSLDEELSRLSNDEAKLKAANDYIDTARMKTTGSVNMSSHGFTTGMDDTFDERSQKSFDQLLEKHGLSSDAFGQYMLRTLHLRRGPNVVLDVLPCANVDPALDISCPHPGILTCAGCKLVRYCSKACQVARWRTHKQDCRDTLKSDTWKPDWVIQRRSPEFIGGNEATQKDWRLKNDPIAYGVCLWGNMPAFDIIKADKDDQSSRSRDITVAFAASGDLRNAVLTVNALPEDYSGELTIVLNDHAPHVVNRNLLLLSILGTSDDTSFGVDVALHMWYSAFVPEAYHLLAIKHIHDLLSRRATGDGAFSLNLGKTSNLHGILGQGHAELLLGSFFSQYTLADANEEIQRVHWSPQRRDRWHKRLCGVEPTHRLALQEYRRFGLAYPFGAANNHFSHPNRTLFTPQGHWLQSDHADPLESWDPAALIEAGKRHGALRGDLYGCLYFYLSEQLRTFAERLSLFKINFRVICMDASALSTSIRDGGLSSLIPSSMRFDRVDVSNILDTEYVGIPGVLGNWGPLLKPASDAAIVGHFMNWVPKQPGSSASNSAQEVLGPLTNKMTDLGRITMPTTSDPEVLRGHMGMMLAQLSNITSVLDNYGAFQEYLHKHGMTQALSKNKLQLRTKHMVLPHRLCAPLGADPNALPEFNNKEDWYLNANIGRWLWSERFIEIERAG